MTEGTATVPTPDVGALAERLRHVAACRRTLRERQDDLARRRDDFERDNQVLMGIIASRSEELDAAERVVRALALTHYEATQDLRPTPGVSVKVYETLAIHDAVTALAWARMSGIGLVPETVDARALLKVAKVTRLPFVTYGAEPRVQIATDLEKALEFVPGKYDGCEIVGAPTPVQA